LGVGLQNRVYPLIGALRMDESETKVAQNAERKKSMERHGISRVVGNKAGGAVKKITGHVEVKGTRSVTLVNPDARLGSNIEGGNAYLEGVCW